MFAYFFKHTERIPLLLLLIVWFVICQANLLFSLFDITTYETLVVSNFVPDLLAFLPFMKKAILPCLLLFGSLLLLQAVVVNNICNKQQILGDTKSNLAAPFLILLMGLFNTQVILTPAFVANIFFLLSLHSVLASYNNRSFSTLFNASFFLGIASLIYLPCALFQVLIFIIHFFYRQFDIREWLASLIAFLIPAYLFFVVAYLFDFLSHYKNYVFANNFSFHLFTIQNTYAMVLITLFSVCAIYGLLMIQKRYLRLSIAEKDKLIICFFYLVAAFIISIISGVNWVQSSVFLVSILSILLTHAFYFTEKTKVAELFVLSLLLSVLFLQHFKLPFINL